MNWTIDKLNEIAKSKNGTCLSNEYLSYDKNHKFQCSEGHIFYKKPRYLSRNRWCDICSRSISESICLFILNSFLGVNFEKIQIKYNGRSIELDGYNKDINLAFEYNGRQHYEKCSYTKTDKDLLNRNYLDNLKIEYCKANNINLLIIPHTISNIEDYIKEYLLEKKYTLINVDINIKDFIDNYSYLRNRRDFITPIINKKCGTILEFNPGNILLKCKEGHIWRTKYYSIKSGKWCIKCAIKNSYRKLSDIKKRALSIGYKCLSNETEYSNIKSLLKFECDNGHIFMSDPNRFYRSLVQNGSNRKTCKYCLLNRQNNFLSKIESYGMKPIDRYKNRSENIKWVCKNNHIETTNAKALTSRMGRGYICKECNKQMD